MSKQFVFVDSERTLDKSLSHSCTQYFSLIQYYRYGQPPADIIKELAPGLEFDEEGMPKMDGQGMGMPGMPPFAPGDEKCSIM